jgi:hypothetical protein
MIRNSLYFGFIHGLSAGRVEGRTRGHNPVLGGLGATAAGAHFDAARVNVLLGFALRQIELGIDGAFGRQILPFLGLGSALPTITSLLSGFCCRFLATSSKMALQVLSTRQGFFSLGKSHWLSLAAFGGGGGGFSTVACVEA